MSDVDLEALLSPPEEGEVGPERTVRDELMDFPAGGDRWPGADWHADKGTVYDVKVAALLTAAQTGSQLALVFLPSLTVSTDVVVPINGDITRTVGHAAMAHVDGMMRPGAFLVVPLSELDFDVDGVLDAPVETTERSV